MQMGIVYIQIGFNWKIFIFILNDGLFSLRVDFIGCMVFKSSIVQAYLGVCLLRTFLCIIPYCGFSYNERVSY